jgi:hypothetical protein
MINALVHVPIYASPLSCEASTLGFSAIVVESLATVRATRCEGVDVSSRDVYNLLTIVAFKSVALATRGKEIVGGLADQEETIAGGTLQAQA